MSIYLAMGIDEFREQPDYDKHYWNLLGLWRAEKDKLACSKSDELHYRTLLGQATFTDPIEGSNTRYFGDTKKAARLVLKQPLNRRVDANAIKQCIETLRETIGAGADEIVRWKPELSLTAYTTLTGEQQALLAPAITTTPGTPQLKFMDAKE